jgi:hypothetical protein
LGSTKTRIGEVEAVIVTNLSIVLVSAITAFAQVGLYDYDRTTPSITAKS